MWYDDSSTADNDEMGREGRDENRLKVRRSQVVHDLHINTPATAQLSGDLCYDGSIYWLQV